MKDQASLNLKIVDAPISSAALTGHISIRATSTGLKAYDDQGVETPLGKNSVSIGPGLTGDGASSPLAINYSASHAFTGGFSVITLSVGSKTLTESNVVLLDGGTIPAQYIGNVSGLSALGIVLPVIKSDATVHVQVEYCDNPSGGTYTRIVDTSVGTLRDVTYAFNGTDNWVQCPPTGFDVSFSRQPGSINLDGILSTTSLHYIRYRFVDNHDNVSEWYGVVYPATADTSGQLFADMTDITVAPVSGVATIPLVQGGFRYHISNRVKSLVLETVDNSTQECEIVFTADSPTTQVASINIVVHNEDDVDDPDEVTTLPLYSGIGSSSVYKLTGIFNPSVAAWDDFMATPYEIWLAMEDNVWVLKVKRIEAGFYTAAGIDSWDEWVAGGGDRTLNPDNYWETYEVCRSNSSNLASTTFTTPDMTYMPESPIIDWSGASYTVSIVPVSGSVNTMVNLPAYIGVIGDIPPFTPGTYILNFKKRILVAAIFTPGVSA